MSIELIIFLATWFVSTEFIFFVWIRGIDDDFLFLKMISILAGALFTVVMFGIPWFISTLFIVGSDTPLGLIVYVWYYGIALAIGAFFSINYAIHKWLEGKGK